MGPRLSYLRPPSPHETASIREPSAEAASAGQVSIGRVLARSLAAVRGRWLTLALLTYGLGFAPRLGLTLGFHPHFSEGDVAGLAMAFGRTLAIAMCLHVARAAVTSAVVCPGEGALGALAASLAATPALAPMWLASEYYTFWSYWSFWAFPPGSARPNLLVAEARILGPTLAALVIALVTAATLGVLTPVVIAERLSLWRAIGRCWALMRGSRWRILGLYVLVCTVLVLAGAPGTWLRMAARSGDSSHVYATLEWVQSAVFEALDAMLAVVLASAYLELVRNERGVLDSEVAEVFA